jgi:hypothetical protein
MTDEADSPPGENQVTMDRLTKVYIKMRDKMSELTRDYETAFEDVKAQQAEVAGAMKDLIRSVGGTGMKTQFGTVSLKTNTRYYAQDWEAMGQFIVDNAAPQLLEKRIAQKNMSDFLEQNPGVVPPGLNTLSEITVSVTKPRK